VTQPVALYHDGAVDEVSWYSAGGILKRIYPAANC
jgi:hypothetical protein